MINIGEVYALKTSGERVVVLNEAAMPRNVEGEFYTVRRPMNSTENGISHVLETYSSDELETLTDNLSRDLNEMKLKMKLNKELSEFQDSLIAKEVPAPKAAASKVN